MGKKKGKHLAKPQAKFNPKAGHIVLALLAAVIVLLAPTFRALLTYAVDRSRSHTRTLLAGLPHPRPPSLLVLSISRT